jgi:hypothetical protein
MSNQTMNLFLVEQLRLISRAAEADKQGTITLRNVDVLKRFAQNNAK